MKMDLESVRTENGLLDRLFIRLHTLVEANM